MLLKHLYDLAHSPRRHILDDDAFESRPIRFVITLAVDGRFLGVQDISPDGKRGKEFPLVPKTARAKTQGGVAEFLADGIDSVFGLDPDPSKPKDSRKLRAKFDDFWSQINDATAATRHPGLTALCEFKPQPGAVPDFLRYDAANERWMVTTAAGNEVRLGNGAFTFRVGEELLFENEQWIKPYWRKAFELMVSQEEKESDVGLCLITGERGVPIARTHKPPVGNIPGVISSGGKVVSFEKSAPAFSSYGKDQSNNAPCSMSATRAYSKALQFLVDRKDHHIRIEKTKLCFWTRDHVEAGSWLGRFLNQPQDDEVKKFLASPWSGIPREVAHRDEFFAVTLAGNSGRIVVRHWLQEPLDRAIENLHRWFSDLELRVPPKPKGKEPRPSGKTTEFHPLSVYWLSCATVREAKDIAPETPTQFYRAALERAAPSVSLIKPILDQLHSKLVRDEKYNPLYDQCRFALLKLIVNRNRRKTDMEIEPQLTAKTDDPAYNCGRLLAILAAAQDKAHDYKLEGAGVAERYFGTASVSPGSVFPLLVRLNRHHLNKISKSERFGGHERFIERQIEDVLSLFRAAAPGAPPVFPRTLDLQSQGRFALGFYQQMAADHAARQTKKNDDSKPETDESSKSNQERTNP